MTRSLEVGQRVWIRGCIVWDNVQDYKSVVVIPEDLDWVHVVRADMPARVLRAEHRGPNSFYTLIAFDANIVNLYQVPPTSGDDYAHATYDDLNHVVCLHVDAHEQKEPFCPSCGELPREGEETP